MTKLSTILKSYSGDIYPISDNTYTVGLSGYRYHEMHADTFYGTASEALYADLAEIYTSPKEYSVGSVVRVSDGNDDVELCNEDLCMDVVGVISENPGFILNSGCEGQAIALTGKVDVLVKGKINKRDIIVPTTDGCTRRLKDKNELLFKVGYALESNDNEEIKLVKCIVK